MKPRPRAVVIRAAGTNCDEEMCRAFDLAGADVDLVHLGRLLDDPSRLAAYDLIGLPGGFSYGDDIASGRVFATQLRERLYPVLRDAAARGVPMIGACNGFQILVQVGLLPGPASQPSHAPTASSPAPRGRGAGEGSTPPTSPLSSSSPSSAVTWPDNPPEQTVALTDNAAARFIDRWVRVEIPSNTRCVWTKPLAGMGGAHASDAMMLPIAHGEGRFVADSPSLLAALRERGQIAALYAPGDNPNGSEGDIAGICDASGRIFGLMPHPERYLSWTNHPFWTRLPESARSGDTPGLTMFKSAVAAAREGIRRGSGDASTGASAGAPAARVMGAAPVVVSAAAVSR